jgi:hypothetical protein
MFSFRGFKDVVPEVSPENVRVNVMARNIKLSVLM